MNTILNLRHVLLLFFTCSSLTLLAQAPKGVIIGNGNLDPSAVLQMEADSQGVLLPSLTVDQRNDNIINPADALLIYNKTSGIFNRYQGGWKELDDDWSRRLDLSGAATNSIYRLDGNVAIGSDEEENVRFYVKTLAGQSPFSIESPSGDQAFRVYSDGDIGIRSFPSSTDFLIRSGGSNTFNLIVEDADGNDNLVVRNNGNIGLRQSYADIDLNIRGKASNDFHLLIEDETGINNIFGVSSDGNVGIRTSSSNSDLSIRSDATNTYNLIAEDASGNNNFEVRTSGNSGVRESYSNIDFTIRSNATNDFNLLIEDTDGSDNFEVRSNGNTGIRQSYTNVDFLIRGNETNISYFLIEEADGDDVVEILDNGDLRLEMGTGRKSGGGDWAGLSDRRLKKDIVEYKEGLSLIKQVRPVWYTYNGLNNTIEGARYIGVIAQELEEFAPHMVSKDEKSEDGNEYLTVDGSAFTYMLINAVQEQQEQIETLENKYDELLKRIEKLEAE